MQDIVFVAATIFFFAIAVLYLRRLRTPEIVGRPGMLGNILLIVICVLLLGYLLFALLKPEKF